MADTQPPMGHEDSIDSQDPNNQNKDKKQKSRRPANTAFRQQRLKAWQPILTPKTVLPLFFAIGIIFAPLGGGLLYASAVVQEVIIDYSRCYLDAPEGTYGDMPSGNVQMHFAKNSSSTVKADPQWKREATTYTWPSGQTSNTTKCYLMISTPNTMKAPILYYYQLTNFYQNHRRYAKSFNTDQLSGKAVSASTVKSSDCDPLTTTKNDNGTEIPYYPCGLAANSQFNDTFYQPLLLNPRNSPAANETYNMTNKGISWSSDRQLYGESKYDWANVAVPPNWVGRYGDQYSAEDGHHPDLVNDEEFQVWMRLAGLPTFSKLALRNDTADMIDGTYEFVINHNFDVTEYGGTKSIIISTRTVMGGKNPFLGIAYVVVGGICIVLGALFTVTHLIRPRKLGDHTYLSWNNENANAGGGAMTSGRDGVLAGEGRA